MSAVRESCLRLLTSPERAEVTAIVDGDVRLTYDCLARRVVEFAQVLGTRGLRPGDRLAVAMPNGSDFIVAFFAALVAGYPVVFVNDTLSADDADYILRVTAPRLVLRSLADGVDAALEPTAAPGRRDDGDVDRLGIFFTSGTTSRPKGVCHRVVSVLANAAAFNRHVGLSEDTRMLHVMPMGYMAGVLNTLLCPLMAGGTVVVGKRFSAAHALGFWRPAREHGANAVWLSPTMAALLTRLNRGEEIPRWSAANLRHVFVGTAPLLSSVQRSFESTFGVRCLESYGLSESMLVAGNALTSPSVLGSVGTVLDGVEVVTRDGAGQALPPGTDGRLFVKTGMQMEGYLDPSSGTVAPTGGDGWFDTGDMGHLDERGYLFITGRTKDLIIHGGVNVSPRAVEDVVSSHPDVAEVAVVGRPDPFWGESVVAHVVPTPGATCHPSTIIEYCKSRLGSDAVPSFVVVRDSLPRSSTGKVAKNRLEEQP